jgi:hypothetical protein
MVHKVNPTHTQEILLRQRLAGGPFLHVLIRYTDRWFCDSMQEAK